MRDDSPDAPLHINGLDPLDAGLLDAGAIPTPSKRRWSRPQGLALGLSPSTVPVWLFLLMGAALGPHGVRLLPPALLSLLDPVVPVALAALGALVGLGLVGTPSRERRPFALSAVDGVVVLVTVFGGLQAAGSGWVTVEGAPSSLLALALGICASTSATAIPQHANGVRPIAAHVGDADDVTAIVLGGLLLAFMREGTIADAAMLIAQASGAAVLIAAAGWLLLTHSTSETEQRVCAIASVLLLGGAAEYLSLSALLCGLIAGVFWSLVRGPTGQSIQRDVLHLQHPLVILVLLVAGARVDLSSGLAGLAAVFLFLRTGGKIAGGWVATRLIGRRGTAGLSLMSPGIIGIAYALNLLHAVGPASAPVLAVAVTGAVASDLLVGLVRPERRTA